MIANPPERLTEDRTYPALLVTYPPERLTEDGHIQRYGRYGSHDIRAAPLPACPFSDTPEGDRKD